VAVCITDKREKYFMAKDLEQKNNDSASFEKPAEVIVENKQADSDQNKTEENTERKFSQDEVDRIVSRRSARMERHYKKELSGTQQQAVNNVSVAPSENHVFDNFLGWIPKDTSREQYSSMLMNHVANTQTEQQNPQKKSESIFDGEKKSRSLDQYDRCLLDHDDAEAVLNSIPIASALVEYSSATDKDGYGIENLYRLQKEDPKRLFEISRLQPAEQTREIVLLHQEMSNKRQKKIKSNATPQPQIIGGNSPPSKDINSMTYAERKALAQKREDDLFEKYMGTRKRR
jgi:hypothetical protein